MEDLREYINQWLFKAENDILTAQRLIEIKPFILDTACFHCQQAIEKCLKAYLVYRGERIIRTHNIDFLLSECSRIDESFNDIDTKNIDDFAVAIRYPDHILTPEMEEAKYYFMLAIDIKDIVSKKIIFK